jgi:hypothetical protein
MNSLLLVNNSMSNELTKIEDEERAQWAQATRAVLPPPPEPNTDIVEARSDFDIARENLLNLVDEAKSAVNRVSEMATVSQTWQYYNVLNGAIKTAVEANEKLIQIHKTRREIGEPAQSPRTVKNQLIVTSADMLTMLQKDDDK